MIQKRIVNPWLVEKRFTIGTGNPTRVSLLYLDGIADRRMIDAVVAKLQADQVPFIKTSGHVSDILERFPWSLFPQTYQTERPDVTSAHLMEGKAAILVDGYSFAIILPVTFIMYFQAADDYNLRWWNGTFLRTLRLLGALVTLALPSVYIAVVSNHFEVLPVDLLFSLKASLENVPLNPVVEALFMMIVLEFLKEAAIRLPKSISPALSTVGGLVIGTEVVRANLVSTTMIVVIAFTAVASFAIPSYEMRLALRLVSVPVMFASAVMGFVGIAFSFSLVAMYLCALEAYGVPYFSPFSPLKPGQLLTALAQLPKRLARGRR